jgi:hypothetical protein
VDADVGEGTEPVDELSVEVIEVAEATADKEVLSDIADIAERPLDLALGLGPIGPAGARLKAIMLRQREQRTVVSDVALIVLAGHRGLHAIVEDLDRYAADRLEGLDMTAQQRLQVLVEDVAREQEARVAEHQAEQPDDPAGAGIVDEVDNEASEVDLGLTPGGVSKRTS